MTPRALLFDFDGLLVDTEGPSYRAWAEVYERHGHELPLSVWSAAIGTIDGFDPVRHLHGLGVSIDEATQEARRRRDLDLCDLEELRPGVVALLDEAERRGLGKAIVTSSDDEWIRRNLHHRGLLDRFDAVVAANGDRDRAKPQPTLYLETLALLHVDAAAAVAFEDSPNGVTAARAAGIHCVAVPNEITRTLDLTHADRIVTSLEEVELDTVLPDPSARGDRHSSAEDMRRSR